MKRRASFIALLVGVAVLVLGVVPSQAQPSHGSTPLPVDGVDASVRSAASVPILAAVLTVAAVLLGVRRPRRALRLALALLLVILAFESGRHAVHHLGQAPCQVASALSHLAGVADGLATDETAPSPVWEPFVSSPSPPCPSRHLAPGAGRAPPFLAA